MADDEQRVLDVAHAPQRVEHDAQVVVAVVHLDHHDDAVRVQLQAEAVDVVDALLGVDALRLPADGGQVGHVHPAVDGHRRGVVGLRPGGDHVPGGARRGAAAVPPSAVVVVVAELHVHLEDALVVPAPPQDECSVELRGALGPGGQQDVQVERDEQQHGHHQHWPQHAPRVDPHRHGDGGVGNGDDD